MSTSRACSPDRQFPLPVDVDTFHCNCLACALQEPLAFWGGLFAGALKLSLTEGPLASFVERAAAQVGLRPVGPSRTTSGRPGWAKGVGTGAVSAAVHPHPPSGRGFTHNSRARARSALTAQPLQASCAPHTCSCDWSPGRWRVVGRRASWLQAITSKLSTEPGDVSLAQEASVHAPNSCMAGIEVRCCSRRLCTQQ